MPSSWVHRAHGRRPLLRLLAGTAVATSALLPGTAALADEPAGTTVVGELVQAWAEPEGHHSGHTAEADPAPVSWVETADGDVVPVASGDVADVPAGSTVSVLLGNQQTADDGTAHPLLGAPDVLRTPAADSAPAGPLTNQVTVAMVAPAGTPAGPRATRQEIVDLVNGQVARFWAEETGGAVALGVTASHDWITTRTGCATAGRLWNEVAAAVEFVPGPGKHLLVYIPPAAPGCAYALAEVGSSRTSGGRLYVRDAVPSVIAHEFGHNFGLAHSSGEQCDGAVDAGSCRTVGYRDFYDVMGASWAETGSLNVVQAAALGVLPDAHIRTVSVRGEAGSVLLAPVSGRVGVRALRLTDASGVDYWLEYRPAEGRDAWLGTTANRFALDTGVLLRRAGTFPDTSVLLDGTPSRAAGWDADLQAALSVGTPVALAGGQFFLKVDAITADGAAVSVLPNPPAAARAASAPGTAPAPGAVLPGEHEDAGAAADAPSAGPSSAEVPADDAPADDAATAATEIPQDPESARALPESSPTPGAVEAAGTELAAASEPTDGISSGLVVAGLGAALAGAAVLVVRRLRRPVGR